MKIKQSVLDKTKAEKIKNNKKKDELTQKIIELLITEKYLKPKQTLKTLTSLAENLDWPIGRLLIGINEYGKELERKK
jgi:hypothetical protein